MKFRYSILILIVFMTLVISLIPMRLISSYLNNFEDVAIENSQGKWWSGQLINVYLGSNKIGDIDLNLNPFYLFVGSIEFSINILSDELEINGRVNQSILGTTSFKKIDFKIDALNSFIKGKPMPQALSSLNGRIEYFKFNNNGCISASGTATGEVIDVLGIFRRNLSILADIECVEADLMINFYSQKEGALEGEIIISPDYRYVLEARSKSLTSKIKEITKLNINQTPTIRSSGSIIDLLESL